MSNAGCLFWFLIAVGVILIADDPDGVKWGLLGGLIIGSTAVALMRAADTRALKKHRRREGG